MIIRLKHISIHCDEDVSYKDLEEVRNNIAKCINGVKHIYMIWETNEGQLIKTIKDEKKRENDIHDQAI